MKKINTNKDRLESIEKRGNLIKESFQREFNKIKRIDEDYDDRDRNNPNAPWNLPDGPEFDGDFKIIDDGNNIDDLFLEIYFTGGETASISLFQILKNLKMDKYMNGWNNLLKQPHDENLHSKLTELISSYTTDPSFDGSDVDGPEQDHPTYDDGARDRMRDDKLTGDLGESEGELGDKVSRVIFKEISFNDLLNNGWPDFPLSISPKNGKIYIRVSQDGMEDWDNA